ncbi:MAG: hypothetical protein NC186_03990 [Prevotella sp.]|nr:hypothetical protein [Prevotella sp.]
MTQQSNNQLNKAKKIREVIRRKSTWLPLALNAYMVVILRGNARTWQLSDHATRLWFSIGFEVLIIVALYYFLRRKEQIEERRKRK